MAKPIEAIEFLAHSGKYPPAPVTVAFGDEAFLQRQVLADLKQSVLGEEDGEFSLATFSGEQATFRDVSDELATGALFGAGRRLVVVEEADTFVTRFRAELENYVAKPRSTAVLRGLAT